MREFQDTTHIRVEDPNFNNDRVLTQDESGFNFALGFIDNISYLPKPIDTHGFVEVSIISNIWEGNFNGDEIDFYTDVKSLATRNCTKKDFEDKFYPAGPTDQVYLDAMIDYMLCIANLTDLRM